jgi:hypothetical protein
MEKGGDESAAPAAEVEVPLHVVLLKVEPAWSPSQGAPGIRHYKVGAISPKTTSMVNV